MSSGEWMFLVALCGVLALAFIQAIFWSRAMRDALQRIQSLTEAVLAVNDPWSEHRYQAMRAVRESREAVHETRGAKAAAASDGFGEPFDDEESLA